MTLQFTQAGSAWACEFEVTDKINLHIENAEGILLYQRTAAGKFALIKDAPTSTGPVFDYDLEGLVYPKHIRVICSSLPTYAEVVSDGEITEIKSQTKEVEVTANGTTQVAPDAGYSYLTGVTVKTNVASSGGSGGGEASSMEYLDVSGLDDQGKFAVLSFLGMLMKFETNGVLVITPCGASVQYQSSAVLSGVKAVAYIPSVEIDMGASGKGTMESFREQLPMMGISPVSITKEEFYNLEGGE